MSYNNRTGWLAGWLATPRGSIERRLNDEKRQRWQRRSIDHLSGADVAGAAIVAVDDAAAAAVISITEMESSMPNQTNLGVGL